MNIINILVHRCKCITEMVQDDALLIIYKAWPYFVNYISTPIDCDCVGHRGLMKWGLLSMTPEWRHHLPHSLLHPLISKHSERHNNKMTVQLIMIS